VFFPLFLLREFSGILCGRQKKQVKRLPFCIGIIRFDLALHMMFFHSAFFLIKKLKKKWGEFAGFFLFSWHNR
jgi:hypothetical protein